MLPLIQIGPLTLRVPGLVLLTSLWLSLEVSAREGGRRGINSDRIYNFGFTTLITGILAARLGFVLLNLGLYTRITPWTRALGAVFSPVPGTELAWVGLLAASGAAAYLIWLWDLSLLDLADALAPGAAILAAGIGLANLASGSAYGIPTGLPWGVNLHGAHRHPTQVYLAMGSLAALAVALRLRAMSPPPGLLMQVTLSILSISILLTEPLRADSPVVGLGIRTWMAAALGVLVAALAGFAIRAPSRE